MPTVVMEQLLRRDPYADLERGLKRRLRAAAAL